MKYACLVYHEESKLAEIPAGELEAIVAACGEWVGDLERSGKHIFSAGLQTTQSAATLRFRGGALSVTDGPFTETKEFFGGFTIFEARDLNEAIQVAAKLPALKIGTIEVRPVLEPSAELSSDVDRKIAGCIQRAIHA
jgi:hypothetical protein